MTCCALEVLRDLPAQTSALPAVPFAFIVLRDDASDTESVMKEVKSSVASRIAKYAVPDQILVRDSCFRLGGTALLKSPSPMTVNSDAPVAAF